MRFTCKSLFFLTLAALFSVRAEAAGPSQYKLGSTFDEIKKYCGETLTTPPPGRNNGFYIGSCEPVQMSKIRFDVELRFTISGILYRVVLTYKDNQMNLDILYALKEKYGNYSETNLNSGWFYTFPLDDGKLIYQGKWNPSPVGPATLIYELSERSIDKAKRLAPITVNEDEEKEKSEKMRALENSKSL